MADTGSMKRVRGHRAGCVSPKALRGGGRVLALSAALFGAGCSILTPSPYDPVPDTVAAAADLGNPPECGAPNAMLTFASFGDASIKLRCLGNNYGTTRNRIMSERLVFDVPALGLGLATVANGAFHGAKDLTLALGIGSAGVAGSSLYFSPTTRITAYNGAAGALLCASAVSAQMATLPQVTTEVQLSELAASISQATILLTETTGSTDPSLGAAKTTLLTARDAATKALGDLASAVGLLTSGPVHLQSFAIQVISSATNKVVTGSQNLNAALTLIKAASTSTAPPSSQAPLTGAAAHLSALQSHSPGGATPSKLTAQQDAAALVQDISVLIAKLNTQTTSAESSAKSVTDAWSGFANCSAS